ncbi:hypothetical protein Ae168Ps1_5217 [Pseudonocardia sp. Ae168_Ps1]|nr:hypothetical protein Ae150APs1_5176 [Pseudonocardia sp. Ae150A_Ps1]OLL82811.1 hypothetical protein Ae168Ps1_5217 [Pseudonocardia sp. Ae168_Ps1]OLL83076.1 hypothetical protein Ae263Ps1_0131c [Pseudonocardia sp. Ae263_Ps1]OLL90885.1 hypothetical protein Ae356Ps1_0782 [Pseudonocardia sp. Ae356_Ps1]
MSRNRVVVRRGRSGATDGGRCRRARPDQGVCIRS